MLQDIPNPFSKFGMKLLGNFSLTYFILSTNILTYILLSGFVYQ